VGWVGFGKGWEEEGVWSWGWIRGGEGRIGRTSKGRVGEAIKGTVGVLYSRFGRGRVG